MKRSGMINRIKSLFVITASSLCCMLFLAACGEERIILTTGFEEGELFWLEGISCYKREYLVYLTNMQNQYELAFGEEIWQTQTGEGSLKDCVKRTALARLAKIKMMNLMATEKGITATKNEELLADKAAQNYFSSLSEEEIEAFDGITQEDIRDMYLDYAIAEDVYNSLTSDVRESEISDDAARTIVVEYIRSDSRSKAEAMLDQINEGTGFDELMMAENNGYEAIDTFCRGERDESVESVCFDLGENEVSDVVAASDGNYYIFRCINTKDRIETDKRRRELLQEKKDVKFNDAYDTFRQGKRCYLNQELLDSIDFVGGGEVDTSDFFDVYETTFLVSQ